MKLICCPVAKHRENSDFESTYLDPISRDDLRGLLNDEQWKNFETEYPGVQRVLLWAFTSTQPDRNRAVWEAMEIDDLAIFYTHREKIRRFGKVAFKWIDEGLQEKIKWKRLADGRTNSFAFLVRDVEKCDFEDANFKFFTDKHLPHNCAVISDPYVRELWHALRNFQDEHLESDSTDFEFASEGERRGFRRQSYIERATANRRRVFEQRGYACEVCGFDFQRQFGDDFPRSADVHHKKPLALGERIAAGVDEFAVLCASCHRAAHTGKDRKLEPWDVEELRAVLRSRWD